MPRAAEFILAPVASRRHGCSPGIWLALFGLWPWEELPVLPAELVFLPAWFPLNIYDFGCWARQTVVALTVVSALSAGRGRSTSASTSCAPGAPDPPRGRRSPPGPAASRSSTGSCTATSAGRSAVPAPRRAGQGRALDRRPPGERRLLGGHPAAVGLLAHGPATCAATHLDHPVMPAGLAGLDGFTIEDDRGRRLEACQSPVWDTALAMIALADAGLEPDDPVMRRGSPIGWSARRSPVPGDWSVRRPNLAPGGWAFEFEND